MKTSLRIFCIVSIAGALAVTPAAFAKKPKGGKGGGPTPDGPGGGGPPSGPGKKGGSNSQGGGPLIPGVPGLRIVVPLPPPPMPPPPYYHRTSRVTRSSDSSQNTTVISVQSALKTRGYYKGAIDGDAGPATRSAIRGFREDNAMEPLSVIDTSLLRALGL